MDITSFFESFLLAYLLYYAIWKIESDSKFLT